MKALLIAVGALVLLALPVGKVIDTNRASFQSEAPKLTPIALPALSDVLATSAPSVIQSNGTLVLEAKNTVVFRGPVMGATVSKAIREISTISRNLSKSDVIYLVLDTPGGSVMDGADFIDFLAAIPQEVKTVTMFAASMGFQIAQNNNGERLITRHGTLMSHRAKGGVEGQFDGELETRYKMIKRTLDYLESTDAKRMDLSLVDYKSKVREELWVHGFDAQSEKVADKMIVISCGDSLKGEQSLPVETMFGTFNVVFDACPLYRDPIRIEAPGMILNNVTAYNTVKDLLNHADTSEHVNKVELFMNSSEYGKLFK